MNSISSRENKIFVIFVSLVIRQSAVFPGKFGVHDEMHACLAMCGIHRSAKERIHFLKNL